MRVTNQNQWREEICRQMPRIDFEPQPDIAFWGSFDRVIDGAGVKVVRLGHSPGKIIRTPWLTAESGDSLCLMLAHRGAHRLTYRRREIVLAPGRATMLRSAEPGLLEAPSGGLITTVLVDPALLSLDAEACDRLLGLNWPSTPALRLLKAYLAALYLAQPKGDLLGPMVSRHIVDLFQFAASATAGLPSEETRGVAFARCRAAIAYIDRHIRDPGLNEASVAASQRISVRYLQKLLERNGRRFTTYVSERRLDLARDMLLDRRVHRGVLEIAMACGCGDVSQFHRLFRRRFGETPAALRSPPSPKSDHTSAC